MSDNSLQQLELLQELEEKMLVMLSELENVRNDNRRLTNEIATLKAEKAALEIEQQNQKRQDEERTAKLKGLLHLVEAVTNTEVDEAPVANVNLAAVKPVLIQG